MADLRISNLTKRYGSVTAADNISLTVADGEFVSLLGPSGCGKSTMLAAIAGLERPTAGRIEVGDAVFFDAGRNVWLQPEARDCGLVFQSYALWPHMTVGQNVAFALKLRRVGKAQRAERIEEVLTLVEMASYIDRYPHELSGGQQQRVALARTLAYSPKLLLLDEPLSNLDAKLRDRARLWLAELRTKLKITTIFVTHDQVEALSLSDRIVVMNQGKVVQTGTPQEIYGQPADPFVADFIGRSNLLFGTIGEQHSANSWSFSFADGTSTTITSNQSLQVGRHMKMAIRPEHIRIVEAGRAEGQDGVLAAKVLNQSFVGDTWQVSLLVAGQMLQTDSAAQILNEIVHVTFPADKGILFEHA